MKQTLCAIMLIACFAWEARADAPEIVYENGIFNLKNEPALTALPKSSNKPYWGYFWEFGDNHYSTDKSPKHIYEKSRSYPVRLHLTPYYAVETYKIISGFVDSGKLGLPTEKYGSEPLYLFTSAFTGKDESDMVPGHAYELVLHYSAPKEMRGNGHLFFFYNEENANGMVPFNKIMDIRPYGHFAKKINATELLKNAPQKLKNEANPFKDALVFETTKLNRGKEHRLFFSMKMNKSMEKFRDQDRNLNLTACWLPYGMTSMAEIFVHHYEIEVLSIHDPNTLKAFPSTAFFNKKNPPKIKCRLRFQNEDKGVVENVRTTIVMEKGLNLESVNIWRTDMENFGPCNGQSGVPCYETILPENQKQDSFEIIFRHIGLEGKDAKRFFQSKRSTKAQVEWTMRGSPEKQAVSKSLAKIYFDSVAPVLTKVEKINWRMKTLYLKGGLNFLEQAKTYADDGLGVNAAIGWQNAPLGKGWSQEVEFGAASFKFKRNVLEEIGPFPMLELPAGGFIFKQENLNLKVFDIRAGIGYQPSRFFRIYGEGGISLMGWGKVDLDGWAATDRAGNERTAEEQKTIDFAYYKPDKWEKFLAIEVPTPSRLPGFTGRIGVEAGPLNEYRIGLAYEYRYLNHIYTLSAMHITNVSVYAKVRLKTY